MRFSSSYFVIAVLLAGGMDGALSSTCDQVGDCSAVRCLQGFNPLQCPDGTIYSPTASMCGCCPGCLRLRGPTQSCRGETSNTFSPFNYWNATRTYVGTGKIPIVESDNCAPGLRCTNTRCSAYTYNCNSAGSSYWKPDCDTDGSFKAVQCKNGADPRCFCYSKEGKRIFGLDWMANKDKMKCRKDSFR